jgi:hypothetical protein
LMKSKQCSVWLSLELWLKFQRYLFKKSNVMLKEMSFALKLYVDLLVLVNY